MEFIDMAQYFGEFGAIGVFCIFLLYLHKKGEERLQRMQLEHNSQMKSITDTHQKHLERLRNRYDEVINQYRLERDRAIDEHVKDREKLHTLLIAKLEGLNNSINLMAKQLDTISDQIDLATGALRDLSIDAKARALAKTHH